MMRGTFLLLMLLPLKLFGVDFERVATVKSGIPVSGIISSKEASPGHISVTFENSAHAIRYISAYGNWNTGESRVMQALVEQESGSTIPIITCTKSNYQIAKCSGNIKRFSAGDDAIATGTVNLKLNNTGERKTKWCNAFMNYDGTYNSSGCTEMYERGLCTFTTVVPTVALTTYVAGSREDQAQAAVSWSCPQSERPKIEILDQNYSDDCKTSNEYQDVKGGNGDNVAKYRVKLEGVCNNHTPAYASNGTITTRIFGKGVSAGTGTTSFVMRISLP